MMDRNTKRLMIQEYLNTLPDSEYEDICVVDYMDASSPITGYINIMVSHSSKPGTIESYINRDAFDKWVKVRNRNKNIEDILANDL